MWTHASTGLFSNTSNLVWLLAFIAAQNGTVQAKWEWSVLKRLWVTRATRSDVQPNLLLTTWSFLIAMTPSWIEKRDKNWNGSVRQKTRIPTSWSRSCRRLLLANERGVSCIKYILITHSSTAVSNLQSVSSAEPLLLNITWHNCGDMNQLVKFIYPTVAQFCWKQQCEK